MLNTVLKTESRMETNNRHDLVSATMDSRPCRDTNVGEALSVEGWR